MTFDFFDKENNINAAWWPKYYNFLYKKTKKKAWQLTAFKIFLEVIKKTNFLYMKEYEYKLGMLLMIDERNEVTDKRNHAVWYDRIDRKSVV